MNAFHVVTGSGLRVYVSIEPPLCHYFQGPQTTFIETFGEFE